MILFGEVKCRKQNSFKNPTGLRYFKNEKLGEKELKWSSLTIFSNFRVLHKTESKITSARYLNENSNDEKIAYPVEIERHVDGLSSEEEDEASEEDLRLNPSNLRNEKFTNLSRLFQTIRDLNPNLLHQNVIKLDEKFFSFLREEVEVQLLKFIPSQFFLVVGNQ